MKPVRVELPGAVRNFDLAQLYQSAPVALCSVDPELRFIHVNEHMAKGNGLSVEEHIGMALREILPTLADTIEPVYRRVFETGKAVTDLEVRGTTPAAPENERCFLARFDPVFGEDGTVVAVSNVVRDMTEQKRAEDVLRESEALHRALSETSAAGLYRSTDAAGCTFANQRACELTGRDLEDVLGMGFASAIHPADREMAMAARERAFREQEPYRIEVRALHPDGTVRWVILHSLPEWDAEGKFLGMVGTATDVTHRVLAEQELAAYRDNLEALVEQRTRDLEDAHQKLLLSERLASIGTVAAGLAHQINNPLGGILLAVQHALDSSSDPAAVHSALADAMSESRRCRRIVRSVLRFAGKERLELLLVDPNEVMRAAAKSVGDFADRSGSALHTSLAPLPPVPLDRVAIEELICNLVRNAVEAGAAHVVLRSDVAENGESILLTVQDDGPGIEPEHHAHVFEPFFSTRKSEGGTGLGLAVAQRLAIDHGGTLALDGEPGQGTKMILELPMELRDRGKRPRR